MTFVQDRNAFQTISSGQPFGIQIWKGTIFGTIAAVNAIILINAPFFRKTKNFFASLFKETQFNWWLAIFCSFCAAFGEELLFRGAIQYSFGLWPTAVLFVFIHGYLNPFNWRLSIYGLLLIIVSAGLGYLMNSYGLVSAISAHFVFDLLLFFVLLREEKQTE